MIPGIVAAGARIGGVTPGPSDTDPHWDDVLLLIDASKRGVGADPHWDDVLLLIDGSKGS